MGNMIDKTLKQIQTSALNPINTPNVPPHLQSYPPGVVQTPPNVAVTPPIAGGVYPQGVGMGNTMGTYPVAQAEELVTKEDKPAVDNKSYAKNIEFNQYAMKTGISPNFDAMPDSTKTQAMENFYGNSANVRMMNKAQETYFANKPKND